MGIFSFLTQNKSKVTLDFADNFTMETILEIINSSSLMMVFFTKKNGWIGANKLFFETFEFKNIVDFKSKYESIREIFLSESEEVFTEDDQSWLEYIKNSKQDGYKVVISAGTSSYSYDVKYINVKCHTLIHKQNFYILELEDVTTLHKSEEKAKEIEKLKTKFLSNIGHEFRTPMNGILGFTELLEHTDLQKQQVEYVHMIKHSSKNLMINIETLLDLSQMQGGRLQLENSEFSILEEMEKASYVFAQNCKEKSVGIMTFIDPKLPKLINSDSKKITQIMTSLIQNAVKFTNRGGKIIVEVKLLKRRPNGDCSIGFSVKDNGNGISKEQIAQITDPFTAGTHADERLGVGLSLANGLVNLLGSELKIKSENGNGSYFNFVLEFKSSKGQSFKMMQKRKVKVLLLDKTKIDEASFLTLYLRSFSMDVVKANILDENIYEGIETLYIVADQNDYTWMLKLAMYRKKVPVVILLDESEKLQTKFTHIVDEIITMPLLPSSLARHLEKLLYENDPLKVEKLKLKNSATALVVEDNLINQKLIKILLQEYNIAVTTASDGNEAVNLCDKHKFDIVFMDIDMPEKNGIIATQEIKGIISYNGKTPIVALTAMAMQGDKEMLLREGLDDYIAKPLTREKLENILEKYLKVMPI